MLQKIGRLENNFYICNEFAVKLPKMAQGEKSVDAPIKVFVSCVRAYDSKSRKHPTLVALPTPSLGVTSATSAGSFWVKLSIGRGEK